MRAARAVCWGFDLGEDAGYDVLAAHYNPRCEPEWSESDLRRKCREAMDPNFGYRRAWLLDTHRERPDCGSVLSHDTLTPSPGPPAAADSPPAPPVGQEAGIAAPRPRSLPSIVQQPAQLRDVVKAAIAAIVAGNVPIASMFVHGDCLVRVDPNATKPVCDLSKPQLRLELSKAANWLNESTTREGTEIRRHAYPKLEVVESVHSHREWPGIPSLTAVADVPVITRASGLLTRPGFDLASGVYLLPTCATVPPVSACPTCDEVDEARDLILYDLLDDFPFADDASRANALALFVLPFVRDLIDGPTPLHHIDAPQEGTGKSLLAETWGVVTLGREPEALAEVSKPDDWQKLILAALIEAPRALFLDNLSASLDSGALASSLTSPVISGRLLGFSRMVSAPVRCVWLSTANNLRMSRELVRRTLYIRLDASQDTAWQGRIFKHQLPRWAIENRGRLVWACLTLCQSWIAAGSPPGRQLLGKFEAWSEVVDGILQNAGVHDLLGNADLFRNRVADGQDEWRIFVGEWYRSKNTAPVGVGDLYPLANACDMLGSVLGDGAERSQRTRLGKAIGKVLDRIYDGRKIVTAGKDHSGRAMYKLEIVYTVPDEQEKCDDEIPE